MWDRLTEAHGRARYCLTETVITPADQARQGIGQLTEVSCFTVNLAQDIIQQIAINQLCEDVDVVLAQVVHVVWATLKLVQSVQ